MTLPTHCCLITRLDRANKWRLNKQTIGSSSLEKTSWQISHFEGWKLSLDVLTLYSHLLFLFSHVFLYTALYWHWVHIFSKTSFGIYFFWCDDKIVLEIVLQTQFQEKFPKSFLPWEISNWWDNILQRSKVAFLKDTLSIPQCGLLQINCPIVKGKVARQYDV